MLPSQSVHRTVFKILNAMNVPMDPVNIHYGNLPPRRHMPILKVMSTLTRTFTGL